MKFIFIIIILIFIFFIFSKLNANKTKQKNYSNNENEDETKFNLPNKKFVPYKIIENDNSLKSIVDDYEEREKNAIKDFETRLGKALPNDVIWSILQDLAIEGIEKRNAKLCVNVEYQRGLLLQKEKKFKQAISSYSMGLYYLMNYYPYKLNPINHIIDYVENDIEVIEMAQYKFVNKIKRCLIEDKSTFDEMHESIRYYIENINLKNISVDDFVKEILLVLRDFKTDRQIKEDFNYEKVFNNNSDYIDENFSDVKSKYKIVPMYSDKTIDIEALRNYGKIYKSRKEIPKNLKPFALPYFRNEDENERGVPFRLFDIPNNTKSIVSPKTFNEFILTIYEYILGNKKHLTIEEKINGIDNETMKNEDFRKIRKHIFGEELPSKIWLIYDLTQIDGIGKKTAEKLLLNNVRTKDEFLSINETELKKISPKCINIRKILLN